MDIKEFIGAAVEQIAEKTVKIAGDIWDYAELPYEETRSAEELKQALREEGFEVTENIAKIPTAFYAKFSYGSGKPAAAVLGEFDALAGLSQKASCTEKAPIKEGAPGHGCGHNLLGAGSFAAAVAVKKYLCETETDGSIYYFGCPAEEGAGSKQFISRDGLFDNIDFAYTWHPATVNEVQSKGSVAIMGANFTFDGIASHAGGAPHLGRSALDACELMNVGVNYLREHMIDAARVHYAYSDAGNTAPNVVQDHTVIKYEVRAPKVEQMQQLFARVVNIAKGAALMTETKMSYEITMAFSDYTPNKTLAKIADECFRQTGAPDWNEKDYALAAEFLRTYSRSTLKDIKENLHKYFDESELDAVLEKPLDSKVHPFDEKDSEYESGSTDVGDVGYAIPCVNINVATACLGNVGHSWQNTAFSSSEIGFKGMITAAKVMAAATVETMSRPEAITKAKEELLRKNNGKYTCPLPEYVDPPVGKY